VVHVAASLFAFVYSCKRIFTKTFRGIVVEAGSARAAVNVLINHMAASAEVGGPPRLKPQLFKAEVGGTPRLKPNFSFSDMWGMPS
jgi:hypothetical protein